MLLGVLRWVSLHLAPLSKRHKSSSNPSLCLPDPSDVFKPKNNTGPGYSFPLEISGISGVGGLLKVIKYQ